MKMTTFSSPVKSFSLPLDIGRHSLPFPKMSAELQQVLKVWERTRSNSPIYEFLLSEVEIYDAGKGVVRARLQIGPRQLNSKGSLHGAFSASVTDWAGGMAIASHGLDSTGVSTDIHVSFLSGARAGDWIEIEGRANKVGNSLAFTTVSISKRTESGLTLVAQGAHTKYVRTR
jgi:acyl-coenzyme A thioesterase 13